MIKFYRGLYGAYSAVTHADGIYFATDKGVIRMGGKDYIGPLADANAVKNIALNAEGDKFVVTFLDNTTAEIEVAKSEYMYRQAHGQTSRYRLMLVRLLQK